MKIFLLHSWYVVLIVLLLAGIRIGCAQSSPNKIQTASTLPKAIKSQLSWNKNPFDEKAFIENQGQFNSNDGAIGEIKYAFTNGATQYFFTSSGWTYRNDSRRENTEEDIKEITRSGAQAVKDEDGKEHRGAVTIIPSFVHMNWIGANPDAKIVARDPTTDFYKYFNLDTKPPTTITAYACRKITYIDLYPDIDVEYFFPEGKSGIEYSLILHPGADLSVIKMAYSGATNIFTDKEGNVQIKTSFGDFIDHAPITHYQDGSVVESRFKLADNTVSFGLSHLRPGKHIGQTLIIDPWTIDPGTTINGFTNYDSGYDVDYDNAGNVYAYGGRDFISGGTVYTYRFIKYNSAGTRLFSGSINFYDGGCAGSFINDPCYGDFAVDASSQRIYIVEGFRYDNFNGLPMGARVVKIDASDNIVAEWDPGYDTRMGEMWRIIYNSCTNQAIIAGGGTQNTYQACILDTTLSNLTPVNVLSADQNFQDFTLLAIDNYSNCFMASSASSAPDNLDNKLLKTSASSLLPVTYMVDDNHTFYETGSIPYVMNVTSATNGFNGIAVNANYLYTYDGSLLQQWDKNSGTLLQSRNFGGTVFASGGIDINDCDTIYLGFGTSILKVEPANLSTVSTVQSFAASGNIYDLKLGPGNMLYATGRKFIAAISLPNTCGSLNLSTASTLDSCAAKKGTASVTPLGGVGPFNYTWSPGGMTTSTITGLSAGTYTVTVNDLAFSPCNKSTGGNQTTTVTVTSSDSVSATANSSLPSVCNGQSSTLTAGGGSTYLWGPGGATASSITVNPSSSTTYTVTVTGAGGCTGTATTAVTSNSVTATSSASSSICSGQSAAITASGGGTYSWNPGGATTSAITVSPLSLTTYTVTVTGGGGCTDTATTSIAVNAIPPAPTITKNALDDTLFSTTDVSYVSYQWYRNAMLMAGETNSYLVVSPTDTSNFTVLVQASDNCTNSSLFSNRTLPIELLSFDAAYNGKTVDLFWTTASEINNDFFTVERTKNGFGFTPIAYVKGAGNSNTTLNYYAVDENPLFGISAYRLKQTDFDGKYAYSRLVAVNIKSGGKLNIIALNKDQEQNSLQYFVFSVSDQSLTIEITDRIGRVMFRQNSAEKAGGIDLSGFAHGIYLFRVFDNSGSAIKKFIY